MDKQNLSVLTFAERPELEAQLASFGQLWPEFIFHGAAGRQYYHHTNSTFAHFHLYLTDADDQVLAAAVAAPLAWDGSADHLPAGWDAALQAAVEDAQTGRRPTTLCALGAMVREGNQGKGLGSAAVQAMKSAAAESGYDALIAPVRPTSKSRYPLIPIDRYIRWRRPDGSAFDPWIRTHERVGGKIIKPAPESMVVEGAVAEWEAWTGMPLPETGDYIVPHALVPVTIDREADRGRYVEPNVWMYHQVIDGRDGRSW